MRYRKFNYKSKEELLDEASSIGVALPYADSVSELLKPYELCGKHLENKIVIQPLEGCDADEKAAPGELTRRRYRRFVQGGAGLVWFEATAIVPEGRAQAHQLMMNEKNVDAYKYLVEEIKETCLKTKGYEPVIIQQLTHSGRYSKPNGFSEPWIARNNPLLEREKPIENSRIITDSNLKRIEETYYEAARLSAAAGFDGADVKACHGYLGSELLAAFTRKGEYGGSYENRTRFLKNSILAVRSATPETFIVSTRLGLTDYFPYPYGWGVVQENGSSKIDLTEPLRLIDELKSLVGLKVLNVSIASPYVNPHISRPYERGGYEPDEHPLKGVARFIETICEVQEKNKELPIINAGFSYLRQFAPNVAAGALEKGAGTLAGFGRAIFANPDLPRQLYEHGCVDEKRTCVSCSLCTDHLRKGCSTGCFIRDREIYHD
ncbi:MAG: flavin oxidoreductase/NADH oxidase [Lachnospiraceae bacterium]|nr:flavin oxidoreductase/NADH oxidase [Lachnospiraceae bacterium]